MTLKPDQVLSHYRLIEQIGEGGMGVVYRARDEHLGRDVAVKVLPERTVADEAARKRFRKEAKALSKLNHPNIQTVHDFDSQGAVDFLVTEYVTGVTLSDTLTTGHLPEKTRQPGNATGRGVGRGTPTGNRPPGPEAGESQGHA